MLFIAVYFLRRCFPDSAVYMLISSLLSQSGTVILKLSWVSESPVELGKNTRVPSLSYFSEPGPLFFTTRGFWGAHQGYRATEIFLLIFLWC